MQDDTITESIVDLIRRTSTDLPDDVETSLRRAAENEDPDSTARGALESILENVQLAREQQLPLCQDTGVPCFRVTYDTKNEYDQQVLTASITAAVRKATQNAFLRPNAVDPLSDRNYGDGIGPGMPPIHFHPADTDQTRIDLLLKGGGSENVSAQYKLPDSHLGAARDLDGVRRCVLDAVFNAQGRGCAPGIIGVGIGGDRETSWRLAKEQAFRRLDHVADDEELMHLEHQCTRQANELEIGPMGFGGRTTVLAVKAAAIARHPACFFVTISYTCWACRRGSILLT